MDKLGPFSIVVVLLLMVAQYLFIYEHEAGIAILPLVSMWLLAVTHNDTNTSLVRLMDVWVISLGSLFLTDLAYAIHYAAEQRLPLSNVIAGIGGAGMCDELVWMPLAVVAIYYGRAIVLGSSRKYTSNAGG